MKKLICIALSVLCLFPFALTAAAAVQGDADGSGTVDAADARLVLRYSVGLEILSGEASNCCDMNDDGEINVADARLILRLAVGLPIEEEPYVPPVTPVVKTRTDYINDFADLVSYSELSENMGIFCNSIGSRWYTYSGFTSAQTRIKNILSYNGYTNADIDTSSFYCNGVYATNIYATIPTAVSNPDIILFCAHYDSYSAGNGAVDNGSGLCTVLELSRVMKAMNKDFGVEVRFAFFACEELGYYGAYNYVNSYAYNDLYDHTYIINVDMGGHFDGLHNYDFLSVSTGSYYDSYVGTNDSSDALDTAKGVLGSCGEDGYYTGVCAGLHDLIPFRNYGLDACTLSWRVIDYSNAYYGDYGLASSPYIHTSYDTMSYFDMDSLYYTARLLAGAAGSICYEYAD